MKLFKKFCRCEWRTRGLLHCNSGSQRDWPISNVSPVAAEYFNSCLTLFTIRGTALLVNSSVQLIFSCPHFKSSFWLSMLMWCSVSSSGNERRRLLPERLFAALLCCLEDDNHRVRCAAAIALYALNRPSLKVIVSMVSSAETWFRTFRMKTIF